jgi:hypothetical protein
MASTDVPQSYGMNAPKTFLIIYANNNCHMEIDCIIPLTAFPQG